MHFPKTDHLDDRMPEPAGKPTDKRNQRQKLYRLGESNDSESPFKAIPARSCNDEAEMEDATDNKHVYYDIKGGQDHDNQKDETQAELSDQVWPSGNKAVADH